MRVTGNTRKSMQPNLRPSGMCDITGFGIENVEKLPYATEQVGYDVFRHECSLSTKKLTTFAANKCTHEIFLPI